MSSPFSRIFLANISGQSDGFPVTPTSGESCKYYASHNPVIVLLTREDRDIVTTADDGSGFVEIEINAPYTDNNYSLTVGGKIYVRTATIDGTFTVTALPDTTHIVIDAPFAGAEVAGFVNFVSDVTNFYMSIRLTSGARSVMTKHIPDSRGEVHANISGMMKQMFIAANYEFENLWLSNKTIINYKDTFLSSVNVVDFKINFDNDPGTVFFQSLTFYGCNAGIPRNDGRFNNMMKFFPEHSGQDLAMFTSQFGDDINAQSTDTTPTARMWRDTPFDLQFIYSDELGDEPADLYRVVDLYVRNQLVNTTTRLLNSSEKYYINRMRIDNDAINNGTFDVDLSSWTQSFFTWTGGKAKTVNSLGVLKQTFSALTDLRVRVRFRVSNFSGFTALKVDIKESDTGAITATSLVASNGTFSLDGTGGHVKFSVVGIPGEVRIDDVVVEVLDLDLLRTYINAEVAGPTTARVTQYKWIEVVEQPCNPVVLKWLGANGSWNEWTFGTNQSDGIDIKDGEQFSPYIEQQTIPVEDIKLISKDATPTLVCFDEHISTTFMRGLRTLISSPLVYMLTNPSTATSSGSSWEHVCVAPGSFKLRETRRSFHSVELKLILSKEISQSL